MKFFTPISSQPFNSDRFFSLAITISLCVHLVFLLSAFLIKSRELPKVKKTKIKIVYSAENKAPKSAPAPKPRPQPMTPRKIQNVSARDNSASVALIKERPNNSPDNLKIYERTPAKTKNLNMNVRKTVSVPMLQSDKINNPSYSAYYALVRKRIEQRAYFNYSELYAGEVYLTFILNKDGTLKDLKIIEEKTTAGQYLRAIGLKSVKEASPHPVFPKSLRYPELTFNVVISFQVND